MHRATRENHTLGIKIKVRILYIPFIMSKLISVHDGDMLVGVLNKKYVQKNARSAFKKRKNVCDTIFGEWGRIFENDWSMIETTVVIEHFVAFCVVPIYPDRRSTQTEFFCASVVECVSYIYSSLTGCLFQPWDAQFQKLPCRRVTPERLIVHGIELQAAFEKRERI